MSALRRPGRWLTALVFDLLVGVWTPFAGEVQQRPHGLDRAEVPWVLPRIARREQQFGRPAEPDHTVVALVEDGEDRHLLPLLILAVIVALEAVVRSREQLQIAPASIPREGGNAFDRSL